VTALLSGYARITLHQMDTQTSHGTLNAKCFIHVSGFRPSSGTVRTEGVGQATSECTIPNDGQNIETCRKHLMWSIIIIMALQPFVGPWPLFHFDPKHSR
jgi:hypothetical protein